MFNRIKTTFRAIVAGIVALVLLGVAATFGLAVLGVAAAFSVIALIAALVSINKEKEDFSVVATTPFSTQRAGE